MSTITTSMDIHTYTVVHPLDDAPEQKCGAEHLGRIEITRGVKISLLALRGYLLLMMGMLAYHVLNSTGILHRI